MCDAKPSPELMQIYWHLDPNEKTLVKFDQNRYCFVHKYTFENVICEMAAIRHEGDELI